MKRKGLRGENFNKEKNRERGWSDTEGEREGDDYENIWDCGMA